MPHTAKDIWTNAIAMQPLERIPFWPKLWSWYPAAQEPPFCDMDLKAIHEWIGSDFLAMPGVRGCVKTVRHTTSVERSQQGDLHTTIFRTPHGEMRSAWQWDAGSASGHPVEPAVKGLDDIRLMIEFCTDVTVELDVEGLAAAKAQVEDLGLLRHIAADELGGAHGRE